MMPSRWLQRNSLQQHAGTAPIKTRARARIASKQYQKTAGIRFTSKALATAIQAGDPKFRRRQFMASTSPRKK